ERFAPAADPVLRHVSGVGAVRACLFVSASQPLSFHDAFTANGSASVSKTRRVRWTPMAHRIRRRHLWRHSRQLEAPQTPPESRQFCTGICTNADATRNFAGNTVALADTKFRFAGGLIVHQVNSVTDRCF